MDKAKRSQRRKKWEASFSPWALAAAGAVIATAFLFQHSLTVRAAMFLCFLGAAWLSGKKVSLAATAVVSAGIIAANLLVPVGKVLVSLGPLRITETALVDGIGKALIFEGLVYISKATILSGLRLPGRFGALVASSFVYYERILEYGVVVRPSTLIEDADRLMLKIWDEPLTEATPVRAAGPGAPADWVLLVAVLAAFLPLLLGVLT